MTTNTVRGLVPVKPADSLHLGWTPAGKLYAMPSGVHDTHIRSKSMGDHLAQAAGLNRARLLEFLPSISTLGRAVPSSDLRAPAPHH